MSQSLVCPHDHHWPNATPSSGQPRCPVCGANATLPDAPEEAATIPPSDADAGSTAATFVPERAAGSHSVRSIDGLAVSGYEILGQLGRGGMGVVYKARQLGLNRLVALKMILARGTSNELTRFRREVEAVGRVQHANVVQVYEVGEHEGRPYLAMEYVGGGSLADLLNGKPLPSAEAARFAEALAAGLDAIHGCGLIHRDLKPANILLQKEEGGRKKDESHPSASGFVLPKIADFGLAKNRDWSVLTAPGAVLGTPSYMAPEQAAGQAKDLGPAMDVYALGAILYEMLTGRPPFRGSNPLDTVLQALHEAPVPPRTHQPGVPRDLEFICLKCLEKKPAARYASACDLADDLRRFREGRPISARPVGSRERAWLWVLRNPTAAALSAAVVLALLLGSAAALFFAHQARQGERQARLEKQRAEASYRLALEALEQCVGKVKNDPRLKQGPMEDLRRTVLQAEALFYQKFLDQKGDDTAFLAERGRALRNLGEATRQLGGADEALGYYRQARDTFLGLANRSPTDPYYRTEQARCNLELNRLYDTTGKADDASQALREAIEILKPLREANPDQLEPRLLLAQAYTHQGRLLQARGQTADARQAYHEADTLAQALVEMADVRDRPDFQELRDALKKRSE